MNTKEVFEETGRLGNELNKEREKIMQINRRILMVADKCHHEIVFKYTDDHPRKISVDESYFCPACGKTIKCYKKNQINETVFKESRIIPLTNLSLVGSSEVYQNIRLEVYYNIDYYYDKTISTEELSLCMEKKLVDLQTKYERPEKALKKQKKI